MPIGTNNLQQQVNFLVDYIFDFIISSALISVNKILKRFYPIIGHAADIIECNDNYGLAQITEGRLEAFHKLMKKFRDRLSRKTSLADGITDIFCRLYLHSHPMIRSKRPKRKKKKRNELNPMQQYNDCEIVERFLIKEDADL